MNELHLPAGSTADGVFETVVDPGTRPDWSYTGLRVLALGYGGRQHVRAEGVELMVIPLSGGCSLRFDQGTHQPPTVYLHGRANVFDGSTDVLYAPPGTAFTLQAPGGGRFAIASAVVDPPVDGAAAEPLHPVARIPDWDVPIEVRGGGSMTRVVRNFGSVGAFDGCERIIACEVITPGGNWSSYPAHKHDEQTASESELEEIYYYEIQDGPEGTPGIGYHRTSTSDPERPIEVLAEVRSGDTVLVPHGWHGPCAAAPGHDMYYLNVMAGPGPERAWNITDHPEQTWVRGTWEDAGPDPRAVALRAPARAEGAER